MNAFVLTDAAIERALAPGLDVAPPADFTRHIAAAIAAHPHGSRPSLLSWVPWPRHSPPVAQALLLILLLLALVIGAVAVGALPRTRPGNGHLIISTGSELVDIDPQSAVSTTLLTGPGKVFGIARSDDGRLISFWTQAPGALTLELVDGNGANRRRLAQNVLPPPIGEGQIDVWSPDRRWLAAGVLAGGIRRILLVDATTGTGELIGPDGAANPLWSPDGQLLAFSRPVGKNTVLSVMHPDGTGLRDISGDLGGFNASGANNWSPDGIWVYFGAERFSFAESHIYRANLAGAYSEQLTFDVLSAAPALSPDGKTVAYSDWVGGHGTQNLMLMDADGGNPRVLLVSAINDGWSNDGQFVLAETRPASGPYELVTIRPQDSAQRTLMTFPDMCIGACFKDLAWGQPRP
jgi:Tol biopolymer transport system component